MNVILVYDAEGRVLRWRPQGAPSLNPDRNELAVDGVTRSQLRHVRVDTSTEPHTPVFGFSDVVDRGDVSEATKEAYRDADSKTKRLDILFEILTGEEP